VSFTDIKIMGPSIRGDVVMADRAARGFFGLDNASGRVRRFFGPGQWRQALSMSVDDLEWPARVTVKASRPGVRAGVVFDRGEVPSDAAVDVDANDVTVITAARPLGLVLEVWATDDVEVQIVGSGAGARAVTMQSLGLDGDTATEIAAVLAAAETQLDQLREERDRINGERATLGFFEDGLIGIALGLADRAASFEAMIAAIDRFVEDVYNRVEKQALAGDLAAAKRLERATRNILAASRGATPFQDLDDDVTVAINDSIDDAVGGFKITASIAIPVVILVLVAVIVLKFKS